jgi:hypothetical protein
MKSADDPSQLQPLVTEPRMAEDAIEPSVTEPLHGRPTVGNYEPMTIEGLAEASRVDAGIVADFFVENFGSYEKYAEICKARGDALPLAIGRMVGDVQ